MMATGQHESNRKKLPRFDAELLTFAERWAPFGGGHEFIFAEFGLTVDQFYCRLRGILAQLDSSERDPFLVALVRRCDPTRADGP
jgi:hypothetical protein